MNIAIIFAGGVGKRLGADIPKQFVEIKSKPIIIHTLELFENNMNIDAIIISCVENWVEHLKMLTNKYNISKVKAIVKGGTTGQMSIFNALSKAYEMFPDNSKVLIHDGVRPFITNQLINDSITQVSNNLGIISSVLATETFTIIDSNMNIVSIPKRENSLVAKAPQSFILKDIYNMHIRAQSDGIFNFIDSCTMMNYYGYPLKTIFTDYDNIKITTPKDVSLAESIYERRNKDNVQ